MALHVIVGKGPVGTTTAEELVARGHAVRVLSRSGGTSTDAVEHRQVDAADATALTAAAAGADVLYNAVNPAYDRWATDWPPVASGGRYDALTAVLGQGAAIPAVGGIIRPGLVAELECAPC